jgi:uncharacterized damage-inducible protein DinB
MRMEHIRKQLYQQILGGNAFKKIEDILKEVPFDQLGKRFDGLPYTFWQQFEHMRITQKDILDFSLGEDYQELEWPKDYWTEDTAPRDQEEWKRSKQLFFQDREAILSLIQDSENDLTRTFVHGDGQTLFREGLLILEHNAYHTGQLMIISRLINNNQNNSHT